MKIKGRRIARRTGRRIKLLTVTSLIFSLLVPPAYAGHFDGDWRRHGWDRDDDNFGRRDFGYCDRIADVPQQDQYRRERGEQIQACRLGIRAARQSAAFRVAPEAMRHGFLNGRSRGVEDGAYFTRNDLGQYLNSRREIRNDNAELRREYEQGRALDPLLRQEIVSDSRGLLEAYAARPGRDAGSSRGHDEVYARFRAAMQTGGGRIPPRAAGQAPLRYDGVREGYAKSNRSVPSFDSLIVQTGQGEFDLEELFDREDRDLFNGYLPGRQAYRDRDYRSYRDHREPSYGRPYDDVWLSMGHRHRLPPGLDRVAEDWRRLSDRQIVIQPPIVNEAGVVSGTISEETPPDRRPRDPRPPGDGSPRRPGQGGAGGVVGGIGSQPPDLGGGVVGGIGNQPPVVDPPIATPVPTPPPLQYFASPQSVFQRAYNEFYREAQEQAYRRIYEQYATVGYERGYPIGQTVAFRIAFLLGQQDAYNDLFQEQSIPIYRQAYQASYAQNFESTYDGLIGRSELERFSARLGEQSGGDGVFMEGEQVRTEADMCNVGGRPEAFNISTTIPRVGEQPGTTVTEPQTFNINALACEQYATAYITTLPSRIIPLDRYNTSLTVLFSADSETDSESITVTKPLGFDSTTPSVNLARGEITVPFTVVNPRNRVNDGSAQMTMFVNGQSSGTQNVAGLARGRHNFTFTFARDFFELINSVFTFRLDLQLADSLIQSRDGVQVNLSEPTARRQALLDYFRFLVVQNEAVLPVNITRTQQMDRLLAEIQTINRQELELGLQAMLGARNRDRDDYRRQHDYWWLNRDLRLVTSQPGILAEIYMMRPQAPTQDDLNSRRQATREGAARLAANVRPFTDFFAEDRGSGRGNRGQQFVQDVLSVDARIASDRDKQRVLRELLCSNIAMVNALKNGTAYQREVNIRIGSGRGNFECSLSRSL